MLNATQVGTNFGCSLQYAIRVFRRHGLHLYRLLGTDAVFVAEELAENLARHRPDLQFPLDEFDCYQKFFVATSPEFPIEKVRHLFFGADVYDAYFDLRSIIDVLGEPPAILDIR